jgi:DeoR/GlpR family transcriptional regulator of sugar metabolism
MSTFPNTLREERQRQIAEMVAPGRSLRVLELSRHFGVSEMTIRRDLAELEADGVLLRVHGGAVARAEAGDGRTPFAVRQAENAEAKRRIARAVLGLIGDGETVIIDIGTTCLYVAMELRRRESVTVVTNSINAALEVATQAANRAILLGGQLHGNYEHNVVGPQAIEALRRYRVDKLVLGAGAVTLDRGFVYFDVEETEVRRAMLEVSAEVIVAADHSKFGSDSFVALAPLERARVIVTDQPPEPAFQAELARRQVRLVTAA